MKQTTEAKPAMRQNTCGSAAVITRNLVFFFGEQHNSSQHVMHNDHG